MKPILSVVLSAALLPLAGAAAADQESAAAEATKAEMAARIGVDVGDYSLRELATMSCRLSGAENDAEKARLLREFTDQGLTPPPAEHSGHAQMAAALGVDASDYTTAQLVLLRDLATDETCNIPDPASYATGAEQLTPASANAKNQLAMSMGVDATEYTLAELVRMHEAEDN
ncbi:MAG: hypothetical protein AAGF30_14650 [Pseudomonadota bacterium]